MINRILPVIFASLLLVACGGGGGGGGGTTASNDTNSNTSGDTNNEAGGGAEDGEFSQQQSEYLPLIVGAGWDYDAVTMTAETYGGSDSLYSLKTEIVVDEQTGEIAQVVSSAPDRVGLKGFTATNFEFEISAGIFVTLKSLIFDREITLLGSGLSTVGVSGDLTFDVRVPNVISLSDRRIDVEAAPQVSNISNTNISTPWGNMAGTDLEASLRVTGEYDPILADPIPVDITILEESSFVPGIGPVSRQISFYINDELGNPDILLGQVFLNITDLENLPAPIVYTYDGVNLTQPDSTIIREKISEANFDEYETSEYELLNEEAFDSLDWAEVGVQNTVYVVDVFVTDPEPEQTLSSVVYVSESGSNVQIPVNVTLEIVAP